MDWKELFDGEDDGYQNALIGALVGAVIWLRKMFVGELKYNRERDKKIEQQQDKLIEEYLRKNKD